MLSALISDLKLFISLVLISLLIFLLDSFNLLSFPKAFVQNITTPIQFGLYKTSRIVVKQFEFIVLARRASQENKAITEQLAQILSENSRLRKKLAEAEGFLTQEQALNSQTFDLLPVRPVGSSRFLYIDKGLEDGVKKDQAVIFKDTLIGKIHTASPKKSQVLLTSDPDFKIGAFVSNQEGKAKGILSGEFGQEMLMDKVLHQEPLNKNDLVYTEGEELEIPRGLILGQVSEIDDRDNEVFKRAKVKTIFDIADLDIIFVVLN